MESRNVPLSNADLMERAPAVFAGSHDPDASGKYAMIRTVDVVDLMRGSGFVPFAAKQTGEGSFGRHLIRFRHEETGLVRIVGGVFPEVVLLNAHDRSSSYRLLAGLFRLVCGNGLIVAESLVAEVRIKHVGEAPKKVIEMSRTVLEGAIRATAAVDEWSKVEMSDARREHFAEDALALRYEENKSPIDAPTLLRARRGEDVARNLWTTFNVVQENLIVGGLRGVSVNSDGQSRRTRTRPVRAIDADLKLNRGLWSLAERVAETA